MAILNIRKLPDHVHANLRVLAARNGRSMEAEARDILTQACTAPYEAADGSSIARDAPADTSPNTITLTEQQLAAARAYAERHQIGLEDIIPHMLSELRGVDDTWVTDLFTRMDRAAGDLRGESWTRDELYRA
jgi:antitoxin FitA